MCFVWVLPFKSSRLLTRFLSLSKQPQYSSLIFLNNGILRLRVLNLKRNCIEFSEVWAKAFQMAFQIKTIVVKIIQLISIILKNWTQIGQSQCFLAWDSSTKMFRMVYIGLLQRMRQFVVLANSICLLDDEIYQFLTLITLQSGSNDLNLTSIWLSGSLLQDFYCRWSSSEHLQTAPWIWRRWGWSDSPNGRNADSRSNCQCRTVCDGKETPGIRCKIALCSTKLTEK